MPTPAPLPLPPFGQARTIPAAIAATTSTRTTMSHDARMPEITPEFTPKAEGSATFEGSYGRPGAQSLLEGVSSCPE